MKLRVRRQQREQRRTGPGPDGGEEGVDHGAVVDVTSRGLGRPSEPADGRGSASIFTAPVDRPSTSAI